MTVYVDDMAAPYKPSHRPGRTYVMCHMIADTEDELHAMADKIGVARKWHQGDHYDIAKSKRALAVEYGAVALDRRTLGAMAMLRRWGQPMGDPATAQQRMLAYKRPSPTSEVQDADRPHGDHRCQRMRHPTTGCF